MHESRNIKCLIVDDEPPAREVLRHYATQLSSLEIAAECENAIQAFAFLQKQPVDLIFLDIAYPEIPLSGYLKPTY